MDLELFLPIPTLISVLVTILLFGLSAAFFVKWSRSNLSTSHNNVGLPNSETSSPRTNFSKCTSPECVRCRNYSNIIDDLPQKFEEYVNQNSPENGSTLERVKDSVVEAASAHQLGLSLLLAEHDHDLSDIHGQSEPNPTVFYLCGLETKPWYERHEMCQSDLTLIENSFATIWDEFSQVYGCFLEGYNRGWLSNTVPTGHWNVFHLYNQGIKVNSNCDRCPGTTNILGKLSTFMSGLVFGNASFSVLQAGTHITEHFGPCNIRVRCHLGLQIPSECTMTVSHESRPWVEEGCILFDDSHLHEAKHGGSQTDGPRAVFMLDLWNPGVTEEEQEALKAIFSVKL